MEQLLAFLGASLNLSSDRLAEILYKKADDGSLTSDLREEAATELLALDKERVSKLKVDTKQFFDNGYKKAQAEVSGQWERLIKDKTGVETDEVGEKLVEIAFGSSKSKPAKTEDEIKSHQTYLQLEKKYLSDLELAKKEKEDALEELKKQYETGNTRMSAKSRAKARLLNDLKPVLEDDPQIAETRINDFLREFDGYDYEQVDDDFVPKKEGKRLENEHFHPITFNELVDKAASKRFKFIQQDPKESAGNRNNPASSGGSRPVGKFGSKEDFEKAYFAEPDREKRTQMAKDFQDSGG